MSSFYAVKTFHQNICIFFFNFVFTSKMNLVPNYAFKYRVSFRKQLWNQRGNHREIRRIGFASN